MEPESTKERVLILIFAIQISRRLLGVSQYAGRKFETPSEKGGLFSSLQKGVSEIRKWTIPGSVKLST
jgi:hypothetical protein